MSSKILVVAVLSAPILGLTLCSADPLPQAKAGGPAVTPKSAPMPLPQTASIVEQLKRTGATPEQVMSGRVALSKVKTLHSCMTRGQLLRVLQAEGGVSTPNYRRYVYMLAPDAKGRSGLCVKVVAQFISRSNYSRWLVKRAEWTTGRPMVMQDTSSLYGLASAEEKNDDIVTGLSGPILGYFTMD